MRQRTEGFRLDYSHSLARGLVFAGLGQSPGSVRYKDSSSRRNDGALTNMTPSTDWCWVPELGRWGLDFDGNNQKVNATSAQRGLFPVTFSAWISPNTANNFRVISLTTSQGVEFQSNQTVLRLTQRNQWDQNSGSFAALVSGQWYHVACSYEDTTIKFWLNGISLTGATRTPFITTYNGFNLATDSYASGSANAKIVDPCVWHRALTLPEIQTLADRSDPMLGGLVLPPKRKYYAITYNPITAGFLFFKQNNKFLSLKKV